MNGGMDGKKEKTKGGVDEWMRGWKAQSAWRIAEGGRKVGSQRLEALSVPFSPRAFLLFMDKI